ncbi:MAG: TRAP transporter substrate-binding protein DctP [Alphaproteobacteria bacterium]|nr:TRAP transporter substrate-binding protein DctP [Alphaproteobacteria bacterium]
MLRLASLLCAGLLAASAPAGAAEQTLRFGTINLANTPTYDEILVPFARALEEKSGGRLAVDIRPLGGFGGAVEMFPKVERGELEIAGTVPGYHPGRFPRSSVMELPMMFDTAETGTTMLWSLYDEGLISPDYEGVKVLALYMLPPYGIFTLADQKLTSLRGLRLRTPSITVGLALAKLGAIPIGLPTNLIGTTLNDKLIDGVSYGWDTANTTKTIGDKMMVDQLTYLMDANFAAPSLMTVMSRKVYDALAPDLRKVIDDLTGRSWSLAAARARDQAEAKAKATLTAGGKHQIIKLTAEERRELTQRIAPVIDEWATGLKRQGIDGPGLLTRARALGTNS